MLPNLPDPKETGRYLAMAQVGLEMAAPIGIGALLDWYFGWGPWGVICGAVLGLVGGLAHLVHMLNRDDGKSASGPGRESQ